MPDLPDKVIHIEMIKLQRSAKRLCACPVPSYEIDQRNRFVRCTRCEAVVEPFEALTRLAKHYDALEREAETLLQQTRQIAGYKPHLATLKALEQKYQANNYSMMPTCPTCRRAFDLAELLKFPWIDKHEYLLQK